MFLCPTRPRPPPSCIQRVDYILCVLCLAVRESPLPVYSASIIFFASFVWPHVKLLFMHKFFFAPHSAYVRRNGNFWLAFFGKW